MKKPMTPADAQLHAREQLKLAEDVLTLLQLALKLSKQADNKRTVARIRLALSSAKGAVRINSGRVYRADERAAGRRP